MRTMVGCGSVNESICMYSCVLYTVLLLIFPNVDIDTFICETLKCDMEFFHRFLWTSFWWSSSAPRALTPTGAWLELAMLATWFSRPPWGEGCAEGSELFLVTHCSNRITGSDFKAASLGDSYGRCGHGLPRHVSEVEGKSNRLDLLHQLAGLPPPSLPTPASLVQRGPQQGSVRGSLHRAKVNRVSIGATIDEAEVLNCIDLMWLKSHLQPSSHPPRPEKSSHVSS